MPGWDEVLMEIKSIDAYHAVRRKHINAYCEHTGRNAIFYYSSWLSKDQPQLELSIIDSDMVGFMNAVKDIDRTKGLDLFLHTPGGTPTATEAIVKYLREMFGTDIRAIVPQLAMSAGTMLACSCKSIAMGKQSSLGPIDPQFGGIPAYDIKKVFDDAKEDMKVHPENINYWAAIFQRYNPAIIYSCINAISLSSELVNDWLISGMFEGEAKAKAKAEKVVKQLNQNADSKNHGRHFDKAKCRQMGLVITDIEDKDNIYQDLVLSIHHAYMLLLSNTPTIKIIENSIGKAYVIQQNAPSR